MASEPAYDHGLLDFNGIRRSCRSCGLYELCLPAGIGSDDLTRLDDFVRDKRTLERGDTLFQQGDLFHSLYVVRSGALKTMIENKDGSQQILGFQLPGEIVGIDALANDQHQCVAQALERTSVCELPYSQMQRLLRELPTLQRQLMRVVSREVVAEQRHLVMMGRQQAQERLAIFLRSLSERYGRLSRDTSTLVLPMSRYDIANYLGLVVETVSRLFTRMESAGILKVNRKTVRILDAERLAAICDNG